MGDLKKCDSPQFPIPFLNNIIDYLQSTQEAITPNYTCNIVNKIFRKTHKVYKTTNTPIECLTLASIYNCVVTSDQLNPNYQLIESVDLNLQENQFSIIQVPCLLNETYHFIILCNFDDDNFKVYNAYGNIYIRPFIINKAIFLENYNTLLTTKERLLPNYKLINNKDSLEEITRKKKEITDEPYIKYNNDFSQIPAVQSWKIITGVNLTKTFKSMFDDDGKPPEVIGIEFNEPNDDIPDEELEINTPVEEEDIGKDGIEFMEETWNDYMLNQYINGTVNTPVRIYQLIPNINPQLEVGVGVEAGGKRRKKNTKKHRKRNTKKRSKRQTKKRSKRHARKRNTKN